MPRSTTVTITATAVTLACLSASLYASPPVVAETMGREIQTFSPLNPETYPITPNVQEGHNEPPLAQAREHSIVAESEHDDTAVDHSQKPVPRHIDDVTLTPVAADDDADADPTSEAPGTNSPRLPNGEGSLPELNAPGSSKEAAEAESPIPDDLDSPDSMTVVVNKLRPLPSDYEPTDLVELPAQLGSDQHSLREEAANATQTMFEAAQEAGISLTVVSAYRSYEYQTELYDNYVRQHGMDATNRMSARPGYSEHQTGLALDVDTPDGQHTLSQSFGETDAGQWLAEHAHDYGFVIRYPKDAHDYTGFQYEPWHLRYFGEQYAQYIVEHSGVAEREFGLDPAPDYKE